MQLDEAMAALAESLPVADFTAFNDGRYVLELDGWLNITFIKLDRNCIMLRSAIADLPSELQPRAELLRRALRDNVAQIRDTKDVVSVNRVRNSLELHRILRAAHCSPIYFEQQLEDFANQSERWINHLSNRPMHVSQSPVLPMQFIMP